VLKAALVLSMALILVGAAGLWVFGSWRQGSLRQRPADLCSTSSRVSPPPRDPAVPVRSASASRPEPEKTRKPRATAETGAEGLRKLFGDGQESEKEPPLSLDAVIQRFLDGSSPLKTRCADAWQLAKAGTPEAVAALRAALGDGPSALKAAIGEALGHCRSPEAREMMLSLLNGGDDMAARGAVRGLAASKDPQAVDILAGAMQDPARAMNVRAEAALEMGEIKGDKAFETLKSAYATTTDEDISEAIVEGMGKLPFSQTKDFFSGILASESTPAESRVAALEALGNSSAESADFLLEFAASDQNPDVRAAAVWALASLDDPPPADAVLRLLPAETSPAVRKGIYEALAGQQDLPLAELRPQIERESDPAARIAGLDLLAMGCRRSGSAELTETFDRDFVPELLAMATSGEDEKLRLRSVTALEKSRTPAALLALSRIASDQDPKVAGAAQDALQRVEVHK
jgi:HEAT repeat protein